jgi:hypothetical protein
MMRFTMVAATAFLFFLGLATLVGFLIAYNQMEPGVQVGPGDLPDSPTVRAMVKMLVGITLFTAVGGSIVGNALCYLLFRGEGRRRSSAHTV